MSPTTAILPMRPSRSRGARQVLPGGPIRCCRSAPSRIALALVLVAPVLPAQQRDSARAGARAAGAVVDTIKPAARPGRKAAGPPVSPGRAFFYSLLIPGLGQATLERPYSGATFFLIEGLSLALLHRSQDDLRIARAFQGDSVPLTYQTDPLTGVVSRTSSGDPIVATWQATRYTSDLVRARALHVEDWVAILVFNHLFAGADAYVAAHLWDLPAHVTIRAAPVPRGAGIVATVPFR